ncbi:dipeptidyl aminopeptidase/acylaminoacyl peptidase [Pseudoxanthomonas broegbernensis]|nr:dipeptidyl aminopeptidase/acylaminoacyl peptidase [Pseudoxanthomonas broegbernensis]
MIRGRMRVAPVFAALVGIAPSVAHAEVCDWLAPPEIVQGERRPVTADDLIRIRDIGPPTVSPDGKRAAFELRTADAQTNTYCIGLYVLDLADGGRAIQLDVGGDVRISGYADFGLSAYPDGGLQPSIPRWSPDGTSLAFHKRSHGVDQLWIVQATGAAPARQMTMSETDIERFSWSDDGKTIVYSTRPEILRERERIGAEARTGFLYDERFVKAITPPWPLQAPAEVFALDLAEPIIREALPDEAALLTRAVSGVDGNVASGGRRAWLEPTMFMRDGALWAIDANDRETRCLADECRTGVQAVWPSLDGREVRFLRNEGWAGGGKALYRWRPGSAEVSKVFETSDRISHCQPAGDELLCLREASTIPSHIVRIDPATGTISTLFDANPEFAALTLQPARRLEWTNDLGLEAFGDLVLPPGHRSGQRHPLIVTTYRTRGFLRGGTGDEYPIQLFAQAGFAVLSFDRPAEPNGFDFETLDAWFHANNVDWSDRRSVNSALEAGIAKVVALGVADPDRVAVTGLSNGASTVEWALSNSDKYAAASISSFNSPVCYMALGGPARADVFREKWGLKGLTDADAHAYWKPAAIALNADRVRTPILVQVSEYDLPCGIDTFAALREQRRPVEMHVFPGEFHLKWQPAHRLALYQRNVQWFKYWLLDARYEDPIDPEQYERWSKLKEEAGL